MVIIIACIYLSHIAIFLSKIGLAKFVIVVLDTCTFNFITHLFFFFYLLLTIKVRHVNKRLIVNKHEIKTQSIHAHVKLKGHFFSYPLILTIM